MTDNIFTRKSDNKITKYKIKLESLKEIIPVNHLKQKNKDLRKTHTEWRWRLLNINDKTLVEISFKNPEEQRKYMNKKGEYVFYNLDSKYDGFVEDEFYVYSTSN